MCEIVEIRLLGCGQASVDVLVELAFTGVCDTALAVSLSACTRRWCRARVRDSADIYEIDNSAGCPSEPVDRWPARGVLLTPVACRAMVAMSLARVAGHRPPKGPP
jgi:hypothetical protein